MPVAEENNQRTRAAERIKGPQSRRLHGGRLGEMIHVSMSGRHPERGKRFSKPITRWHQFQSDLIRRMSPSVAYEHLVSRLKQAHLLGTVGDLLSWDEQVNLPPGAAEQRAMQHAAV